jgi:acetyltransferase-like isoleucine patch superfamily enzyme
MTNALSVEGRSIGWSKTTNTGAVRLCSSPGAGTRSSTCGDIGGRGVGVGPGVEVGSGVNVGTGVDVGSGVSVGAGIAVGAGVSLAHALRKPPITMAQIIKVAIGV